MIRRATQADASSLAAIAIEVWLNTYMRSGVNAFFADFAFSGFSPSCFEEALSSTKTTFWVSQNSGGIDGFIELKLGSQAPVQGCSDLEISTLYVQPRHKGSGIGSKLLACGIQHCRDSARPSLWLAVNAENQAAIGFYAKRGFLLVGTTRFAIGDQTYPNNVLRYDLHET